jgi:hypothetical protein
MCDVCFPAARGASDPGPSVSHSTDAPQVLPTEHVSAGADIQGPGGGLQVRRLSQTQPSTGLAHEKGEHVRGTLLYALLMGCGACLCAVYQIDTSPSKVPLCHEHAPRAVLLAAAPLGRRALPERKPPTAAANAPNKNKEERLQGILQYRNLCIKVCDVSIQLLHAVSRRSGHAMP